MRSGRELSLAEIAGKKLWISYRLQSLTTERFIKIANKILKGEHRLISSNQVRETAP